MKTQIVSILSLACLLSCGHAFADDMVRIPAQGDSATGYTSCPIDSLRCEYENNDNTLTEQTTCKWINDCKVENIKTTSISAFYIDALPVTNADLQKCIDAKKCSLTTSLTIAEKEKADRSKPQTPAVVGYELAEEYCAYMGKSLPTEAQWLAAAMGDKVKKYTWGDEELSTAAVNIKLNNFSNLENAGTMPTDQANGVYDMSGNGYEWIKADLIEGSYPENAACIALNSRPCLGAAPLPLYQQLGLEEHDVATFRCVKSAE